MKYKVVDVGYGSLRYSVIGPEGTVSTHIDLARATSSCYVMNTRKNF